MNILKKITGKCLPGLLLFCWLFPDGLFAQSVDKAKELLTAHKLVEAKTEIDQLLAQEKNQRNPIALYTKAKIYTAISLDADLASQVPGARLEAFRALKKYTEVDDKLFIALQVDGYKPINDIYTGFYQDGASNFNAANYEKALEGFSNAIMVSSFMNSKGWINLKLDTNSVLYSGVSAEKLNRQEEAANYYGLLAENKVTGPGFIEIYKWVANHHYEKKNFALAKKFVVTGREVYPGDPFWASLSLDLMRETGTTQELFSEYEKILAAEPENHLYHYNYAVELYRYGYDPDRAKRPSGSESAIEKAESHLLECVRLSPGYSKAQLFAGQVKYNAAVDLLTQAELIKTDVAQELERKKILKEQALSFFGEAVPFFLTVETLLGSQGQLTAADKADLKEAYELLITVYDQKGAKEKMKEYQVKSSKVDNKQ